MLTLALAASVATVAKPTPMLDAYLSCIRINALFLERSGESAPIVTDVAVAKCDIFIEPLYVEFLNDFRQRPEIKKIELQTGKAPSFEAGKQDTIDGFHKSARSLAISTIVEARAKKASKK